MCPAVKKALAAINSGKADATAIAPAFSSASTYEEGTLCTYQGQLYKCTTAVTTVGPWTGDANWEKTYAASKDVSPLDGNSYDLTEAANLVRAVSDLITAFGGTVTATPLPQS